MRSKGFKIFPDFSRFFPDFSKVFPFFPDFFPIFSPDLPVFQWFRLILLYFGHLFYTLPSHGHGGQVQHRGWNGQNSQKIIKGASDVTKVPGLISHVNVISNAIEGGHHKVRGAHVANEDIGHGPQRFIHWKYQILLIQFCVFYPLHLSQNFTPQIEAFLRYFWEKLSTFTNACKTRRCKWRLSKV